MTNHQGQRCRASEAKTKKYPQSQKEKQGVHGLIDDHSKSKTELSGMDLCRYDVVEHRENESDRKSRSITSRTGGGRSGDGRRERSISTPIDVQGLAARYTATTLPARKGVARPKLNIPSCGYPCL